MRRLLVALPVAVLVGTAGCGGAPSKSSFLTKADAICRADNAPVASPKTPSSFPELADAAGTLASATDVQVPRLRKLSRPSGGKARTDAVFDSLAGVATAAKSLQAAAATNDEKGTAQSANDMAARSRQASDGAKAYGFTTCGGSTQTAVNATVDGAKKVLKAGYVVKAEAFCKDSSTKLDALPDARTPSQAARSIDRGITILTKLVSDLKGLTPPPGDEATITDYLDAQQRVIDKAGELKDAVAANNGRLFDTLNGQLDVLVTAANAKADGYGLTACGTEGSF
jgi:hypothetical protein